MKTVSVLLIEDVNEVGKKGSVIEVNDGFARNFLFRKKLAEPMTKGSLDAWKRKQAELLRKKANAKQDALALKEKIEKEYSITLSEKAGKEGKLFGSITSDVIAKRIKKDLKLDVDKKKIVIQENIKTVGTHKVSLKLYPEVSAIIKVTVKAIED
ncbi:MAG: 50S ribosomal protein L9 [Caldisericia bacterium]|nr:50S ribosomal protein L9 [Caldisericia bacterium]